MVIFIDRLKIHNECLSCTNDIVEETDTVDRVIVSILEPFEVELEARRHKI